MIPKVLTIAGSDSSGGAGVQADLKTFSALGCYGMSVFTALTAQNTMGVQGVYSVPSSFLIQQLDSVFDDVPPAAVKIGMLGDVESIRALAFFLRERDVRNIILDPVMVATSGDQLIADDAVDALKEMLIPLADVITPNIHEAAILSGRKIDDAVEAARDLLSLGASGVLLKGGHGTGEICLDVYAYDGGIEVFEAPRLMTKNTHGTGCTLSSAIAAYVAHGHTMIDAIGEAKSYITEAIRHADDLNVGKGAGPVHHFWNAWT
ncbi:MAG: bifunctional hydroxymethylpyrimidine kinase/phosphomethylpyrimidine kinase [Alphaproteobacteria bacterium]|nr:bifunctional hydroxymethylpyrimidine kinase/phosphomethylpyrimidine kinase [Alphaproteobacteria bacterium]